MKVLSLFDGMACGMIAMLNAGIEVESYDAYEIDKHAIKVSSHNFPNIKHHGDVFQADFTQYEGVDYLVGGSPCTYWSIAQKNNRETEASGMGWELFSQYVRALHEAKPKYFIYENNKSMSKAIRESITQAFGFEPICINSALVSAQNRQRLYWVGKRNPDGTYSKVNVDHPEDRGILLKDVLDGIGAKELTEREMDYMVRSTNGKYSDRWAYLQKPGQSDKALCITANISKGVPYNVCCEPVGIGYRGRMEDGKWVKRYESNEEPEANALTTCNYDSMVAAPVCVGEVPGHKGQYRNGKQASQQYRVYSVDGKSVACDTDSRKYIAQSLEDPCRVVTWPNNAKNQAHDSQQYRIYSTDGKEYTVYEVKDGQITTKGKQYPIKLGDGFYIIRNLTVRECMRLQTVPEWYDFSVISNTQAYKCLGNGWTCEVITHLINATQKAAHRKWLKDLLGDCL